MKGKKEGKTGKEGSFERSEGEGRGQIKVENTADSWKGQRLGKGREP